MDGVLTASCQIQLHQIYRHVHPFAVLRLELVK